MKSTVTLGFLLLLPNTMIEEPHVVSCSLTYKTTGYGVSRVSPTTTGEVCYLRNGFHYFRPKQKDN